ncbi:MAG: hypothetical protein AB1798_21975, partial [Spirochaetota bacterium]
LEKIYCSPVLPVPIDNSSTKLKTLPLYIGFFGFLTTLTPFSNSTLPFHCGFWLEEPTTQKKEITPAINRNVRRRFFIRQDIFFSESSFSYLNSAKKNRVMFREAASILAVSRGADSLAALGKA